MIDETLLYHCSAAVEGGQCTEKNDVKSSTGRVYGRRMESVGPLCALQRGESGSAFVYLLSDQISDEEARRSATQYGPLTLPCNKNLIFGS